MRQRLVVSIVAGALALAGCGGGSSSGGSNQASGPPIKIGVLADADPSTAVEGAEMRVNTDLAVAQINSGGGIHGHPLQVTYVDPKAQPDEASTMAQQLVQQQNVDVLVGGVLSSECLAVENLVSRLQVVYVSSSGCAAEDFTSKQCNLYSFRTTPQGRQVNIPLSTYIVNSYGSRWGIIYPDYAFGQSQLAAYRVGMQAAGGELVPSQVIAIPRNEPNMTPYISRIATDGSINGVINSEVAADLVRASTTMAQFGLSQKLKIVGVFGKERFAGVYPDSLAGDLGPSPELSDSPQDNKFDVAYHSAFRQQLTREDANLVQTLGGSAKAVPGDLGYEAYTAITALKHAMLDSNFTGKADTQKLIKSMANLKVKQSADFPGGDYVMNPSDHQAATTTYIAQINGQTEQVLSTIPPDKLPAIGSCVAK